MNFAFGVVKRREIIGGPLKTDLDLGFQEAKDWLKATDKNFRDAVRVLIAKWQKYRSDIAEPERYKQLEDDLYVARNPGFKGLPDPPDFPSYLIDPDDRIIAAVEHYFLSRSWVGSGQQPAWEMRAMSDIYQYGKRLGVTPRHNPKKPTTPPSLMQEEFKEEGIRDGESDLLKSGKDAPSVAKPPLLLLVTERHC